MEEGTTNDFKSLYDIFDGIAGAWDQLTETQQSRVSEILGGATCSTTSFKNEKVAWNSRTNKPKNEMTG